LLTRASIFSLACCQISSGLIFVWFLTGLSTIVDNLITTIKSTGYITLVRVYVFKLTLFPARLVV